MKSLACFRVLDVNGTLTFDRSGNAVGSWGTYSALRSPHRRSDSLLPGNEAREGGRECQRVVRARREAGRSVRACEKQLQKNSRWRPPNVRENARCVCVPASQSKRWSLLSLVSTWSMSSQVARFVGGMCLRPKARSSLCRGVRCRFRTRSNAVVSSANLRVENIRLFACHFCFLIKSSVSIARISPPERSQVYAALSKRKEARTESNETSRRVCSRGY
jgi:hypothetical protein